MRIHFILIISSIILISCHSKEEFNALETQKIWLLESIDSLNKKSKFDYEISNKFAKKEIIDSIFSNNSLTSCSVIKKYHQLNINNIAKRNDKYESKFQIYEEVKKDIIGLKYSYPTKIKSNLNKVNQFSYNTNIEFTPTSSGVYYWSGVVIIRNERTGKKTEFPILDSIYVLP